MLHRPATQTLQYAPVEKVAESVYSDPQAQRRNLQLLRQLPARVYPRLPLSLVVARDEIPAVVIQLTQAPLQALQAALQLRRGFFALHLTGFPQHREGNPAALRFLVPARHIFSDPVKIARRLADVSPGQIR